MTLWSVKHDLRCLKSRKVSFQSRVERVPGMLEKGSDDCSICCLPTHGLATNTSPSIVGHKPRVVCGVHFSISKNVILQPVGHDTLSVHEVSDGFQDCLEVVFLGFPPHHHVEGNVRVLWVGIRNISLFGFEGYKFKTQVGQKESILRGNNNIPIQLFVNNEMNVNL